MDSGDQNTPESTAREKKGGFWDTLLHIQKTISGYQGCKNFQFESLNMSQNFRDNAIKTPLGNKKASRLYLQHRHNS